MPLMKKPVLLLFIFLGLCSAAFSNESSDRDRLIQKYLRKNERMKNKFLNESKELIGIEILLANPNPERSAERFGHTMIRFVYTGFDENFKRPHRYFQDHVASFVPDPLGDQVNLLNSQLGTIPLTLELRSFGNFASAYISNSKRSIRRFIIPTTKEERESIKAKVDGYIQNPDQLGGYKLLFNNCTTILAELLDEVGLLKVDKGEFLPTSTEEWLVRNRVLYIPSSLYSNFKPVYTELANTLGIAEDKLRDHQTWPEDAARLIHENLYKDRTPRERERAIKLIISVMDKELPYLVFNQLIYQYGYSFREGFFRDKEELLKLKAYPRNMYEKCLDSKCAQEIVDEMKKLHNKQEVQSHIQNLYAGYLTSPRAVKSLGWELVTEFAVASATKRNVYTKSFVGKRFKRVDTHLKITKQGIRADLSFIKTATPEPRSILAGTKTRHLLPFEMKNKNIYFEGKLCGSIVNNNVQFIPACRVHSLYNRSTNSYTLDIVYLD